jgi:hypothetical protein
MRWNDSRVSNISGLLVGVRSTATEERADDALTDVSLSAAAITLLDSTRPAQAAPPRSSSAVAGAVDRAPDRRLTTLVSATISITTGCGGAYLAWLSEFFIEMTGY